MEWDLDMWLWPANGPRWYKSYLTTSILHVYRFAESPGIRAGLEVLAYNTFTDSNGKLLKKMRVSIDATTQRKVAK